MAVDCIGSCSRAAVPEDAVPAAPGAPLEGGTALLPASQNVDVGEAVARMVIEGAFARRQLARAERSSASIAQEAAQRSQITHMREQAEESYKAATTEAVGKIISGGLGIAGGGLGFHAGNTSNSGLESAGDGVGKAGEVATGVAGYIAADFKRDADRLGAEVKADEMRADAEKKRLEGADDDIAETREAVRNALDFLREFQSTQAKAQTTAASIRG